MCGMSSLNNKSCEPCPQNLYGKRCTETCACTESERCDNVKGCLRRYSKSEISTESHNHHEAMDTTGTNYVSLSSKSTQTLDEQHFIEECRSSVDVVIFASVGLLIGFGFGVIFMFFKQFIKRNKRQDPTIAETNESLEIQGETVNAYEEIGDITLVSTNVSINQNEENSDTSIDSSNTEQRSENAQNTDYLNPYQPIPITDPHLYMTPGTSAEATAVRFSSFSNDDKTYGSSDNLMSRLLHYGELEINTLSENNKEPDKYVNTSINANHPTENKASTQKTQYAEIEHTV